VANGKLLWRQPQDPDAKDQNHSVGPVFEAGCVYATSAHGDGGQMCEMSPDGEHIAQRWTDAVLSCVHGGVVVVDGFIYGSNKRGKWVCLELKTGRAMYETAGVGAGSVAYADGMLYCYGAPGTVGLVRASPAGYELAGKFKVTHGKGQHWAHPVISGGRLYIRHGDALMAYDVAAE
jgi:outer membrane protein assembly factor BamB